MANESSKYDKAVARATGAAPAPSGTPAIPVKHQAEFITKKTDQATIDAIMNDPKLEVAPELYTLEEGDHVYGILEGNGPEAQFERFDKATGEIVTSIVKTWIIASPDRRKRISILSSVQLDKKLAPFVGVAVHVVRGPEEPTGNGQRYTKYLVAGEAMPEGQVRNWATKPAIEAAAEPRALPAGDAAATPSNHAHAAS